MKQLIKTFQTYNAPVCEHMLKEPYLIFSIELITGLESGRVQFTLVVLQSLETERQREIRGSVRGETTALKEK